MQGLQPQVYGPIAIPTPEQEQQIKDAVVKLQMNKHDPVSKPKHYMLFEDKNIEVRDLMELLANRLQAADYSAMFISDYIQAMQYMLRFDQKNGKEDICKAVWYFNKMLESYPENKESK